MIRMAKAVSMRTLMKAAPALSMEFTKKAYHQRVPDLSLSLSGFRWPIQMAGTVAMTGTKMKMR